MEERPTRKLTPFGKLMISLLPIAVIGVVGIFALKWAFIAYLFATVK